MPLSNMKLKNSNVESLSKFHSQVIWISLLQRMLLFNSNKNIRIYSISSVLRTMEEGGTQCNSHLIQD